MRTQSEGVPLWGGLECTINRVGDRWMDQVEQSGHRARPGDLEAIAALGLRTLRYGLQWERFCQTGTLECFADALETMQRLGIEPIAGLVHHGSGPEGTDLMDPGFPEKLAGYARMVATRFPHLRRYTPVNEPQTTARFSGLYAHWYPHQRCFSSYVRALVHQIKATVLAMRAIREVQPEAQLVTTEDSSRTWWTPELQAIGEERDHRRWLGVDLLCGRVNREHPMFEFLERHGVAAKAILWFCENPCPPDVIGLNYYLTSDRYLDHQLDHYGPGLVGGDSGEEPLVDIEAVRVRADGIGGAGALLTEAWKRYGIPVAITECHLGGGRPGDSARWLLEVLRDAEQARDGGADVRAVTVWSLLGSWDWSSLVTEARGEYEPGVFDIRSGRLEPTPLAELVRRVAHGERPTMEGQGWWRQPDRFTFPVLP